MLASRKHHSWRRGTQWQREVRWPTPGPPRSQSPVYTHTQPKIITLDRSSQGPAYSAPGLLLAPTRPEHGHREGLRLPCAHTSRLLFRACQACRVLSTSRLSKLSRQEEPCPGSGASCNRTQAEKDKSDSPAEHAREEAVS